jgi:hypothetical protein
MERISELGTTILIVSIPTSFNCNKVLGYPGFEYKKKGTTLAATSN